MHFRTFGLGRLAIKRSLSYNGSVLWNSLCLKILKNHWLTLYSGVFASRSVFKAKVIVRFAINQALFLLKIRAGHFLRLDRNRKPRMKSFWHPGQAGKIYNLRVNLLLVKKSHDESQDLSVPGGIGQRLHHNLPVFLRMSHNIFVSSYA